MIILGRTSCSENTAPCYGTRSNGDTVYVRWNGTGDVYLDKSSAQTEFNTNSTTPLIWFQNKPDAASGGGTITNTLQESSSSVDPITQTVGNGKVFRQVCSINSSTNGHSMPATWIVSGNPNSNSSNYNYLLYPFSGSPGTVDASGYTLVGNPHGYTGLEHGLQRTNGDVYRVPPPIDFIEIRIRFFRPDGNAYRPSWYEQSMNANPNTMHFGTYSARPGGNSQIKESDGLHYYDEVIHDFAQQDSDGWWTMRFPLLITNKRDPHPGASPACRRIIPAMLNQNVELDSVLQTMTRFYLSSQRYASNFDYISDGDLPPHAMEIDYVAAIKVNSSPELKLEYVDSSGTVLNVMNGSLLYTDQSELTINHTEDVYIRATSLGNQSQDFSFGGGFGIGYPWTLRSWGIQGTTLVDSGSRKWLDDVTISAGGSVTLHCQDSFNTTTSPANYYGSFGAAAMCATLSSNRTSMELPSSWSMGSSNKTVYKSSNSDPDSSNQMLVHTRKALKNDSRLYSVSRNWWLNSDGFST